MAEESKEVKKPSSSGAKAAKVTEAVVGQKVKVRLKIKQERNGKRGFIDANGVIKWLANMEYRVGEQEVQKSVWDAAEEVES